MGKIAIYVKFYFTMDKLKRMAIFARVVETHSMSGAARELGMSTSAISQQLRQLEKETGVVLLHRSTRKLTLTEAGETFYVGCANMVHAARQAEQNLADLRDELVGELRIAAPIGFAGGALPAALAPLLARHPQLKLRLFAGDERIDLIRSRIDLAVRIGRLADSTLIARPLAQVEEVICASPDYLSRAGIPRTPEDLARHEWITLTVLGDPQFLELTGPGGERRRVRVEGRIASNEAQSTKQLTLAHLGLSRNIVTDLSPELKDGRLVRVLPDWKLPEIGIHAVTLRKDAQPAKVRHAIKALKEYLARH